VSNFPKFKVDDKVETQYGSKGTVESFSGTNGIFSYKVALESGITMTYKETELKFLSSNYKESSEVHIGSSCPVCMTKYKVTKFGSRRWKDCLKCGKTAEELCAKKDTYVSKKDEESDSQQDFGWYTGIDGGFNKP